VSDLLTGRAVRVMTSRDDTVVYSGSSRCMLRTRHRCPAGPLTHAR
jgi:hypothetical protein